LKITSALTVIFLSSTIVIAVSFLILNFSPKPDLDVEVIQGRTAETRGGIEFMRIKITNYSGKDLTNVLVDMGPDDIHNLGSIKAGQSIVITPNSLEAFKIMINTDEGISVTKYI